MAAMHTGARTACAGIVLAAGSGTRVGHGRSKAYLPLAGRTMLVWGLETLRGAGVERLVLAVRPEDVALARAVLHRELPGAVLDLVAQEPTGLLVETPEPRGRGRPVQVAARIPGDRQRAEGGAGQMHQLWSVPVHPCERGQALGGRQHLADRRRIAPDPVQGEEEHLAVRLALEHPQCERQEGPERLGVDVAVVGADQPVTDHQWGRVDQRARCALGGVPGVTERHRRLAQRVQIGRPPEPPPPAGALDHAATADLDITLADRVRSDGGTGPRHAGMADEGEAGGVAAALLSETTKGDDANREAQLIVIQPAGILTEQPVKVEGELGPVPARQSLHSASRRSWFANVHPPGSLLGRAVCKGGRCATFRCEGAHLQTPTIAPLYSRSSVSTDGRR